MSGLRRGAKGRTVWILTLAVLAVTITLACAGVALADKWTDITDAQWQSSYGVTAAKAATVAAGFADGTFHPKEAVKRGQFAKMVVDGFDVAYYTPSAPTFPDVTKTNTFFKYVEGGVKAGIISGFTDGTFKPNNTVSRQQANNILGSYLSSKELDENGLITGSKGTYSSLSAWYAAEGALILAAFHDATKVAAVHAPGTAYLVFHEVVKGSNGYLTPGSTLTRAQAVALIIRVRETTFTGGSIPTVTGLNPAAGTASGGTSVVITGTNFSGVSAVKFGTTPAAAFTVNSATQISATSPPGTGTVDVTVTTATGTSAASTGSKYTYGFPVITLLSPAGGGAGGNTTVIITGTGFTGVTAVKFGTVAANTYTVQSATSITAVSPAGTNGSVVDVTVVTSAGTSATSAATKFTYGVPTITTLAPAAGAAAGGTTVVITGTGFTNVTGTGGVKFGTVNATSYTVNSTTQITAVAPAGTTGTSVDVVVTNDIGQSGISALATKYSYGPPTITKLSPAGGSESGGETITITGTGFTGVTTVKFGTVAATSVTVTSPAVMTVAAPKGTAGTTVDVYVTTPAGTNSATTASKYSYGTPTLTSVSPAAGPVAGNNSVVITGTNFVGITSVDQVKFGTKSVLAYTVNSATQITCTVPPGSAGSTVDVLVTNASGTSGTSLAAEYSYGPPTVTNLDPAAGPVGGANSVVITGTGFTGVTAVKFGGVSVAYTVNSATKITAAAPAGALDTIVEVTVTTPGGTSASSDSTSVTTDNTKYEYILTPTVSSIDPDTGPLAGGNTVTVYGTYFVDVQSVKFGTKLATNVSVVSDTELTCTAPSGTTGTIVSITVTNPCGVSPNTANDDYAYGIPTITSLSPAAGSTGGGNTVVITGTCFSDVDSVRFYYNYDADNLNVAADYVDATSYTVNSLTQITAVVPAYSDGTHGTGNKRLDSTDYTVDVVVSNSTGSSVVGPANKYTYGSPTITSLDPTGGSTAGGNSVVIHGYGFTGTASSMSVQFYDNASSYAAATITAINTTPDEGDDDCTEITVTVPAQPGTNATVHVHVTTPAGSFTASSGANAYNYGAPTITSINPAAGPNAGGNSVVIHGTGFTASSDVYFGGTYEAATVSFDSSTQLTATAPNHVGLYGTTVDIHVVNGSVWSSPVEADLYSFGVPVIHDISPVGGPSGTTVTLAGTGFTGVISVKFFDGDTTKSVTPTDVDPTASPWQTITVTAPSGLSGTCDVWVVTSAGNSNDAQYSYGIPIITSLSPAAGKLAGGSTVVINGSGFDADNCDVYFDGIVLDTDDYTVNSSAKITVTNTPAASTLPGYAGTTFVTDVQVENASGKSIPSNASKYSYGPPIVTELDPAGGLAAGGNTVTIKGKGFTGITGVKFGTKNATSIDLDEDTLDDAIQVITVVAPAGTTGTTVDVTVTNAYATSSTSGTGNDYTYGIPTVTGLNPASGTFGDLIIITGTNFTGVTSVLFDTTPALIFAVNSSTQITAQVPAGSGTVDVTVANGAAQSATSAATKFSFGVPTITALTPNNGVAAGNTTVVITGTGFSGVTGVTFGDSDALSYTVNSPTQITARPPAGVLGTTVTVQVHTHGGDSNPGSESNITEPWDYHYGVPTITNLKYGSGEAGDDVIITGTNFTDDAEVYFGRAKVTATIDYTEIPTKLTVNVPAHHAGDSNTIDVTVVTGAGASATALLTTKFTYGAPTVTAVNPATGSVGTSVVITGTGFTGVKSVKFVVGGVTKTASVVSYDSTEQITVTAPNFSTGTADVVVSTYGGDFTLYDAFEY